MLWCLEEQRHQGFRAGNVSFQAMMGRALYNTEAPQVVVPAVAVVCACHIWPCCDMQSHWPCKQCMPRSTLVALSQPASHTQPACPAMTRPTLLQHCHVNTSHCTLCGSSFPRTLHARRVVPQACALTARVLCIHSHLVRLSACLSLSRFYAPPSQSASCDACSSKTNMLVRCCIWSGAAMCQ